MAGEMHGYEQIKRSWTGNGSAHASPRFRLIAFDDISIASGRSYLVKGMIPRQGLVVGWGAPKCGKSFWAFDLGMHVALGRDYRGHRVVQGPVVYVAAEGAGGQGARVQAWRGRHLPDDAAPVPFALLPDRLDLIGEADQLVADIRCQGIAPALVVIDTLNRTFSGSESSDEDMTAYIQAADRIKDAFNCAVLVIHHCGHDATRPRGHTALLGAADAQISVKKDADGKIVTKVDYAKDFSDGAETVSRLEVVEVGIDDDGEAITSCVIVATDEAPKQAKGKARLSASCQIALEALKEAIADGGEMAPASNHIPAGRKAVKAELWRRYAYSRNISQGEQDAKRIAFKRASQDLQAKGLVGTWDEWVWLTGGSQ